jgi:hypothetical protein
MLSTRSIFSSFGAFSNVWIRCTSTIPEVSRPPGPVASWNKDEYNAWRRYKYATNTDYRQSILKHREKYRSRPEYKMEASEYHKNRYANDAAYRLRSLERALERSATPEGRKAISQYQRNRYANDSEYRKGMMEARKRWRAIPENREIESQRLKERYANDPGYRERMKQKARERYWKKKFGLATGRAETSWDTPDAPNKSDEEDAKP